MKLPDFMLPQVRLLACFFLMVHITIAAIIFRSAADSGMSPWFWALFYFFTGPIGLVCFMIVRNAPGLSGSYVGPSRVRRIREMSMAERYTGNDTYRRMVSSLPEPSKGFNDQLLADLVFAGKWDEARNHVKEMMQIAIEDGNKILADDYRRVLMWIDLKRNPFRSSANRR